ncbi:hypothetical protein [Bacteroides thetaiotaomicron]|uniref:hypothetical protein n=1 Tax=Bacteroides thetaiotaomicron TaxID=818 RepID=UPI0018A9E65C|nr:hypothetical protein [Bacteroides thetaiotaomicron]MDC2163356.1 hypothetical protein [Bacteroides thetaiotaomicron]
MKGFIIKRGNNVYKAGIPNYGVGLMVNIIRNDGVFLSIGGIKMPGEIHVTWNGGMLKVGDEIEVEFAEFDEATSPVAEESHKSLLETALSHVDDSLEQWNRKLDTYYRLKKILEDENIIEKE